MPAGSFHLENQALTQAATMTLCTDLLLSLTAGVQRGWRCSFRREMFPSGSERAREEMEKGQGEEEKRMDALLAHPEVLKSLK